MIGIDGPPPTANGTSEQAHFDAISDRYYDIVDKLPHDLGYYHREELAYVRQQFCDCPEPLQILDAGCGPGRHAVELARLGHQVTAIDFSAEMLEQAQQNFEA